ncbi:putative transient receptor potential channel [Penaeus vannamei]|uniref:Putative transient receptor potential channel n=1 Tax=Penaeus vannamei TaxID=6689 RepID=A0A3R7NL02_PENVA|nr:putative transient receptor potential channel [Penaeus vannamei]
MVSIRGAWYIAKFLFIFFLVLTSFACGLNQLYWYYDPPSSSCDITTGEGSCSGSDAFNTIDKSYTSLLWSLFGVIPLKELSARQDQLFTDIMGHSLLGAYLITAITVMVNMLIAMMSRSFQIVEVK